MVKMMSQRVIPVADPYISQDDVEAVTEAVKNKRLSQGEYVEKFEKAFSNYLKSKHALAVSNGTAALHLALLSLDVKRGDEVIVPSFTFIASSNCILYVGAKPIFVEINPRTFNIDPEKIENAISPKTKAIIVVHYAGQPADLDTIMDIAEKHGIQVIEDAAEAHGAKYKNKMAGSIGLIGCFSFYPNKNMTTGEGGMVVTNDNLIAEKTRLLRSHGQDSRYHHITLGYNYRMTDIQAALGTTQLRKLDWVLRMKEEAAKYYTELLSDVDGVQTPYVMRDVTHTYMFYTVKFLNKCVRNRVMQHLSERGIETRIAFPPVHLQPFYRSLYGYKEGYLPITEECADRVLSLPIYPHIRREDQKFVVEAVLEEVRKC
jgi:dTDP-4-amino-4,6-dideoxygalactose transaminase